MRAGYDQAELAVHTQSQRHDRDIALPNRRPYEPRTIMRTLVQPVVQPLTHVWRLGSFISRLIDPDQLEGFSADFLRQPDIDEIEVEHRKQRVEHGMSDLGGLAAAPRRLKGEDADQVIDAALKALNLLGGVF